MSEQSGVSRRFCLAAWLSCREQGRAGEANPEGQIYWHAMMHQILLSMGPDEQLAVPEQVLQGSAGVHSICMLPGSAALPTCTRHTTASQRCVKESHLVGMPQSSELADRLACSNIVISRLRAS